MVSRCFLLLCLLEMVLVAATQGQDQVSAMWRVTQKSWLVFGSRPALNLALGDQVSAMWRVTQKSRLVFGSRPALNLALGSRNSCQGGCGEAMCL